MKSVEEKAIAKAKFDELVKRLGFKSRRELAISMGISYTGLENNLTGRYGVSVSRAFELANALKVPVTDILDVFYPELYKENVQYGES